MICPNKVAVVDPPHATLPTASSFPNTHHDPLGLGSTQAGESQPRGVWQGTRDDMVSVHSEKGVRVAEGNRPQVLNASASTLSASSELPSDAHGNEASLSHRDERQIMLDTDRSFVHYPSGEASSPIATPTQSVPDEAEHSYQVILI